MAAGEAEEPHRIAGAPPGGGTAEGEHGREEAALLSGTRAGPLALR